MVMSLKSQPRQENYPNSKDQEFKKEVERIEPIRNDIRKRNLTRIDPKPEMLEERMR